MSLDFSAFGVRMTVHRGGWGGAMSGAPSSNISRAFPAQLIFALLKTFIITTDAGTKSGMTLQTLSLPHPARLPSNFLLLFLP